MPKLPRGAGKATTKERAKKPAAKRAATKTTATTSKTAPPTKTGAGREDRAGHEDRRSGEEGQRRGHDQACDPQEEADHQVERGRGQAENEGQVEGGGARLPASPRRPAHGPRSRGTEDQAHRRRAPPAGRPVRGRGGALRRGRRGDRPRPRGAGVRLLLRPPRRPAARERRGLHHPPGGRGEDLRRHAARHGHAVRGPAARHRRGHERLARGGHRRVRRRDRPARGRPDEAVRRHLPEPRRPPGRELPEDDGRDGPRHPGHPHQARRPPPQHADDRLDAEVEAAREGARDARDLRAARAPARHPRDQVGARGPRLPHAPPAQVQRDAAARLAAARGARRLRGARRRVSREGAEGRRDRGGHRRPRQALLLDLLEDDEEGARVQRDLRPHGHARDRGLGEGLLRRHRRHPLAVEAAARALQGLDRHAQVQHVPGRSTRP